MPARRAAYLPPALMHDVELERTVVGDGSGECPVLGFE